MATTENQAPVTAVRPFTIEISAAEIADTRSRIAATRRPDRETVGDRTQGVQLAKLRPSAEIRAGFRPLR
jgi:hypothetical protein